MPNWNDALEKATSIVGECDGWRHLCREFDANWYHVSRSGLQAAFEREFGIKEWGDLVAMANGKSAKDKEPPAERISHCYTEDVRVAFISDIHAPYHDPAAVALAAKIISVFAPDEVVYGGDGVDFYALSSFSRDPVRVAKLQDELDVAYAQNRILRDAAPNAAWWYLIGNHEERLYRYKYSRPETVSLRAMNLDSLLRFSDLKFQLAGDERWYCDGSLALIHGDKHAKHAGWAVKRELEHRIFQQSIVQGHNHKVGHYSARGPLGSVSGYEVGCLCTLKPEWQSHANWNQGVLLITIYNGVPTFENVMFQTDQSGTWVSFGGKVLRG